MTVRDDRHGHTLTTLAAAIVALMATVTVAHVLHHETPPPPPVADDPEVASPLLVRTPTPERVEYPNRPIARVGRGGAPTPPVVSVSERTGKGGHNRRHQPAPILECIAAHESATAGGYQAVNPTSGAAGRYQLMPEWSDDWAIRYGFPEWASVTADEWPPPVQDAVALALYRQWPGAFTGTGC